MNTHNVTFPKRRTAGTYTANVIGKPKMSKKTGKFVRLDYTDIPTHAELMKFCAGNNIDAAQALARGIDVIRRAEASGGSGMATVLFTKLFDRGVAKDIQDTAKRGKKVRAIVQTILAMKRQFSKKTLDQCTDMVLENL